jgi:predicted patatin/cPLA2 family phospholipase
MLSYARVYMFREEEKRRMPYIYASSNIPIVQKIITYG